MANRDIIFSIIVLAAIGWLLFENYSRSSKPDVKPVPVETVKPIAK
ncbi:MAG: hypothetical protein LLF94_01520 [Chlamydiales bacterium]|nr:hypothetical protein [Chlamydiales bacterium]